MLEWFKLPSLRHGPDREEYILVSYGKTEKDVRTIAAKLRADLPAKNRIPDKVTNLTLRDGIFRGVSGGAVVARFTLPMTNTEYLKHIWCPDTCKIPFGKTGYEYNDRLPDMTTSDGRFETGFYMTDSDDNYMTETLSWVKGAKEPTPVTITVTGNDEGTNGRSVLSFIRVVKAGWAHCCPKTKNKTPSGNRSSPGAH